MLQFLCYVTSVNCQFKSIKTFKEKPFLNQSVSLSHAFHVQFENILIDVYFSPEPNKPRNWPVTVHDCGYRRKIVTSDSLAVKWHIYLLSLHTTNWKFGGVSFISRQKRHRMRIQYWLKGGSRHCVCPKLKIKQCTGKSL